MIPHWFPSFEKRLFGVASYAVLGALLVLHAEVRLGAQGTVNFQNISGTGAGNIAAVSNYVTGARVVSGTFFLVQLYYGAAGASASDLVAVNTAPVYFSQPGFFAGGTRLLDASIIGDASSGARAASVQVRAWQTALGADWNSALAAANSGTHPNPLLGTSSVFTVATGNPLAMPPGTPANLAGLKGFYVGFAPEPGGFVLAALGLATYCALRRRRSARPPTKS